eukprot:SAG31_NODE_23957_length_492_cov_0.982188_1_plen_116_part_10
MTYNFGIGERQRQRVDEAGHLLLTDLETWKLSRTKAFSIVIIVIGIGTGVGYGSPFGTAAIGALTVLLCKLSELLSMPDATLKEKLSFLAVSIGSQLIGFQLLFAIIIIAERGDA